MNKYSFILKVTVIDGDSPKDTAIVDLPFFIDRENIKEHNQDLERVFKSLLRLVNEKLDALSAYNGNQKNSAA